MEYSVGCLLSAVSRVHRKLETQSSNRLFIVLLLTAIWNRELVRLENNATELSHDLLDRLDELGGSSFEPRYHMKAVLEIFISFDQGNVCVKKSNRR